MQTQLHKFSEEFKATAVYGLIIALGCVLSVVVYFAVTNVEKTTRELVDHQIPALTLLRETMANVTEQERLLYEYYATTDRQLYIKHYGAIKQLINEELVQLHQQFDNARLLESINSHLINIDNLSKAFDRNMVDDQTDWDLAREQLEDISNRRRQANQLLDSLIQSTTTDVAKGYSDTLTQLTRTSTTVTWYSIAIVIIALFTGWYMRIYLQTSRRNKRLAAFTERNPHPIISVNEDGQIVYHNPATEKVLTAHSDEKMQMHDLVPKDFNPQCGEDQCPMPFIRVEHSLANRYFSTEIHYLSDMRLYDLHISDITAEKLAQQKLEFQAFHCPDTGLQNNNRLQLVLKEKIQHRKPFALGLAEIRSYNHFVAAHGVNAVKTLVKSTAQRLQALVDNSQHDMELFKTSERTFAFIVEGKISDTAIAHQGRAIATCMNTPLTTEFGEFTVELDIGFCSYPEQSSNADSLMQNAQLALDEAIEDENLDFLLYRQGLSDKLNNNLSLTNQLKSALSNDELYLVFQPQLDIHRDKVIGMETLLRWRRGDQHISPAEFIPIAEQTGQIVEIGEWLLHQACQMTQRLVMQGYRDLVLAVNISPRQFRHPNFLAMVSKVLKQTQLSPALLELEITEGVIMYNEAETITLLHQLKALGIQLSIDDFGTGYSSLSYLKQFPVDKLKVDQSFVKNLHTNDEDKAIVRAIVDLGKNLNLRTIAEGVEEHVHLQFLKSLGCDEIQGYHYSRPLAEKDFFQFLEMQKQADIANIPHNAKNN